MASKKSATKKSQSKKAQKKSSKKTAGRTPLQVLKRRYENREKLPKHSHVPSLKRNIRRTFYIIRKHWKPLGLATAVYGGLYFIFVRVLTQVDINDLSQTVVDVFGDGEESFLTELITVGTLFQRSTELDNQSGMLYFIVTVVFSLALIWMLRLVWQERKPKTKEAYYQGMYPIVPFVLVIVFMLVQFLPFTIAGFFFQNAFNNSLAISLIEKIFFIGVFAAGAIISAYYIIGSIIALYAVTVPGVTPSEARKTAKRILKGRRFLILRQSLIFSLLSGLVALGPMLLSIWLVPQTSIVLAALVLILMVPWVHLYFYGLYRDLIDE